MPEKLQKTPSLDSTLRLHTKQSSLHLIEQTIAIPNHFIEDWFHQKQYQKC